MPVPKCRQHGEQTGGIRHPHAATELGLPVELHTSLFGMALRTGVLQELHTGSSGRMDWKGEEQELCSTQRGGSSAWEVPFGQSKLAQSVRVRSRGQMSRGDVVVCLLHAGWSRSESRGRLSTAG